MTVPTEIAAQSRLRSQTDDRAVLTEKESAAFLRLHSQTVWRLRQAGEGPPHFRVGRRVLYLREDLIAWARARREGGAA